jgi:hypothetical protein
MGRDFFFPLFSFNGEFFKIKNNCHSRFRNTRYFVVARGHVSFIHKEKYYFVNVVPRYLLRILYCFAILTAALMEEDGCLGGSRVQFGGYCFLEVFPQRQVEIIL